MRKYEVLFVNFLLDNDLMESVRENYSGDIHGALKDEYPEDYFVALFPFGEKCEYWWAWHHRWIDFLKCTGYLTPENYE